jgi:hypothetical protein
MAMLREASARFRENAKTMEDGLNFHGIQIHHVQHFVFIMITTISMICLKSYKEMKIAMAILIESPNINDTQILCGQLSHFQNNIIPRFY